MEPQLILDALNKASDFRRAGEHETAVRILEPLYQNPEVHERMDLISGLLYSLQKLGRYQEAIDIAMEACRKEEVWDSIKQNLAWSIYFRFFKQSASKLSAEDAVEWLERMQQTFPQKAGLHPLPLSVFAWISVHPEAQPALQIQLCGLIDPALLDRSPVPPQGDRPALPSQYERYTGIMSKALFSCQRYQECKVLCESVLNGDIVLNGNNAVWLRRRIALCVDAMGDHAKALEQMQEVLKQKRDWFVYHETARIARATGDFTGALSLCVQGALAWGETENKIHLWELLRELLSQSKQFDRAIEILNLIASIRKHKGWSIGPELFRELKAHNVDPESLPHFKELYQKAKSWLADLQLSDAPSYSGKITKLLPDGKAGFIAGDTESYYFRLAECRFPSSGAIPGLRVKFNLEKSFDRKKQRESQMAVNIRML